MEKLHLYNAHGKQLTENNYFIGNIYGALCVVSEIEFPAPTQGRCANITLGSFSTDIRENEKVTLLFGDPIVLEECVLMSKLAKDTPDILKLLTVASYPVWKFLYKGKYFWASSRAGMMPADSKWIAKK